MRGYNLFKEVRNRLSYSWDKNQLGKKVIVGFVNFNTYLVWRKNTVLLEAVDVVYADGILMSTLLSVLLGRPVHRYSFDMTSLAGKVFESCTTKNLRLGFIGGTATDIKAFEETVAVCFPGDKQPVFFRNGFFDSDSEYDSAIKQISLSEIDVIVVGMGAGKQEKFLLDLRSRGWDGAGFTCGAFISQTTKDLHFYPKLINKLHLRWVYRSIKEKGLLLRYLKNYPRGIWYVVKDATSLVKNP